MKLISREWNEFLSKYENLWLADNVSDIASDFDPDCAEGSVIMVISTGAAYMKNTAGKWQRIGSNEVIV